MKSKEYRLAAIMFTDIVGFSRMMEQDEAGTLALLAEHNVLVANAAQEYGGTVIKTIGDAFLVDFPNTVQAVQAGVAILDRLHAWNVTRGGRAMQLRIGIHLGDIHFFDDDALGEGINIASRLQQIAEPGRIAISQDVYNMVVNKVKVPITRKGEVKLKNIQRVIEVYEISVTAEVAERAVAAKAAENEATEGEATEAAESSGGADTSAAGAAGPEPVGRISGQQRQKQTEEAVQHRLQETAEELKDASSKQERAQALAELVRTTVLSEIKGRGRRITLDEAHELFPNPDAETNEALQQLVRKGLISRTSSAQYGGSTAGQAGTADPRQASRSAYAEGDLLSKIGTALKNAGIFNSGRQASLTEQEYINQYRSKIEQQVSKERAGFAGHLGSFIGVNAFLFLINMTTSPGFPWFLFPLFGWGIGMLNHIHDLKRKQDAVRHLEAVPDLNRAGLKLLQEYEQARSGFGAHVVSTVGTSALLIMINLVTSPGFPWALFPIGGMAIGLFAHAASYPAKIRKLRKRMEKAGVIVPNLPLFRPGRRLPKPGADGYSRTQQARIIRSVILGQYKQAKKSGAPLGRDFLDLLDRYVNQIEALEGKCNEVQELISGIPTANLERDLQQLQQRRSRTTDPRLQSEYDDSIQQIQRHKASYRELVNQQEMLNLRLTSSLNSLKQLQIDLVRMQSLSNTQDSSLLEDLRSRSDDLTHYLSDMEKSFAEIG